MDSLLLDPMEQNTDALTSGSISPELIRLSPLIAPPDRHQHQQRRRRIRTSCNYCRHRKIKCDRNKPCSTCVKKNKGRCEYAPIDTYEPRKTSRNSSLSSQDIYENIINSAISRPTHASSTNDRSIGIRSMLEADMNGAQKTEQELKNRLEKMENLLLTIMNNENNEPCGKTSNPLDNAEQNRPEESNVDKLEESLGMLKLDERGKSIYHGDTHFAYLLQEMNDVQELFKAVGKSMVGSFCNLVEDHKKSHSILPNSGFTYSGKEILSSIPRRALCEFLVERYFEVFNGTFDVVNRTCFDKTFQGFWDDPNSVDLIWLSLLFCMLITACQSWTNDDLTEEIFDLYERNGEIWIQGIEMCFSIGRISYKPSLANVRALILWTFVQTDLQSWQETAFFNFSTVVRVAQSMGLHRDPRYFILSPIEAEDRRKLWSFILYLDNYFAISQGLPTAINPLEEDVMEPSNIDFKEFEVGFGRAPAPKDLHNTLTTSSFMILRHRLSRLQLKAYSSHIGIRRPLVPYKGLWELDAEIRTFYDKLPRFFKLKTSKLSKEQPMSSNSRLLLFQKVWLRLELLRSLIVLHRLCSRMALSKPGFNSSRKVTIECSLEVIDIFYWMAADEYGKQVFAQFNWISYALLGTYFMHATIVTGLKLANDEVIFEDLNDAADAAVPKATEVLKMLEETNKISGISAKLLRIFLSFCQTSMIKSRIEDKKAGNNEKSKIKSKLSPFESKRYAWNGRETDKKNKDSVFLVGLDSTDAVYGLNALNEDGNGCENKSSADESPASMITGKSTGEEVSPQSQNNTVPQTYPEEMEREHGLLQAVTSPTDMASQLFDEIFGDDMGKKQDMMNADVWDSFMEGFDQEYTAGISRER